MHTTWNLAAATLNVGLWIWMLIFSISITSSPDENLNSPVRFDIFQLKPYNNLTNLDNWVASNVTGLTMCSATNTPAGCGYGGLGQTTAANLATVALSTMDCIATDALQRPSMCTACVDTFARRIHAYGITLAAPIDTTNEGFTTLYKQMKGCIVRSHRWNTVEFMQQSNVWVQALMWFTIMTAFSVAQAIETWEGCSGIALLGGLAIVLTGFITATVIAATNYKTSIGNEWGSSTAVFDVVHVGGFQLLLTLGVLVASYIMYRMTQNSKEPPEKLNYSYRFTKRLVSYDIMLTIAMPSIVVVMCLYNGLADYDIIVALATSATILMALNTCDDVLNVFWSQQSYPSAKNMHAQAHMSIVLLVFYAIISIIYTDFPTPQGTDLYSGQLQRLFFYGFLIIVTLFPSLFHQFSGRDSREIMYYKEGADIVYRLFVLMIMYSIYNTPNTGTTVA